MADQDAQTLTGTPPMLAAQDAASTALSSIDQPGSSGKIPLTTLVGTAARLARNLVDAPMNAYRGRSTGCLWHGGSALSTSGSWSSTPTPKP